MRNVNSLPNGRIVLACLNCGFKMDLAKYGWLKTVCGGCRAIIENPINNRSEDETKKTNVMLTYTDRQYIQTIATLQGVTKSKALSQILEYSRQEYRAAGGTLVALDEEEDSLENTKKAVKSLFTKKKEKK